MERLNPSLKLCFRIRSHWNVPPSHDKNKMRYDALSLLKCPVCDSNDLRHQTFAEYSPQEIDDGVVWCEKCRNWFPIQEGLLDLLTGNLIYSEDRRNFWSAYSDRLIEIGLSKEMSANDESKRLQSIQQAHFDWYATNELQTYSDYEQQSFWLAADRLTFGPWQREVMPGSWLLDVGCAQGRSTFKLMDLDINIVGFDISKSLVRQAIRRYRAGSYKARATFCLADAGKFPFRDSSFSSVLIYGVLHHLPDPAAACKEAARVLKLNGRFFGSENNQSAFRVFFDVLQRLAPLWHEEAGPQALISAALIRKAFRDTGIDVKTHTSVFLPPHLINLLSENTACQLLSMTDNIGRLIPVVRNHGGLIVIYGTKPKGEHNGIF